VIVKVSQLKVILILGFNIYNIISKTNQSPAQFATPDMPAGISPYDQVSLCVPQADHQTIVALFVLTVTKVEIKQQ
jgi:hypothetical protein